jgi:cation diffusion facilitator CzcD-associated flavoprotein CzcO
MTGAGTTVDVAIIGGGHAGLCVVEALQRRGVAATVFDDASRLGDVWRGRYHGLHLNTERDASLVPGTEIPDSVGSWPTGEQWADHIESAAEQLGVDRRTDKVERVERLQDEWILHTSEGVVSASVVVVATGRNRVPLLPDWPGIDDSPIRVIHAAEYREPRPFAGRRVLVVGAGNSGTEIAHLLCAAGVDVTLSMRSRPVWAQRELFGSNLTEYARVGERLPSWLIDLSGRVMQPLLFGRMKPFGLGPPQHRLSNVAEASGATLDSGFVADVKAGRIRLVAAVDRLDGTEVVLNDGSRLVADVVIAGVGYTPALEEMLPAHLVVDGWPAISEAPFEQAPGLFTAGLNPATLTAFHPDFITEADQIAEHVAARLARR